MSTIYLDPVAMDSTAGFIGEHIADVEQAITGLHTSCMCSVPAHLSGWLEEELRQIEIATQLVCLIYILAALDTAVRAEQIRADQSLATALPSPTFQTTAIVGGTGFDPGGSFSPDMSIVGGTSRETFLANNPLLAAAENLRSTNPSGANQLFGLHTSLQDSNNENIKIWTNSRPGASYIGNDLYKGDDGRIGGIEDVYRNPDRPGGYGVDP